MSRIKKCFAALQKNGDIGLIPYVTAGDPAPEFTVSIMHRLVTEGADIIELGIPFSDPMADGPVIQQAHERSLQHGITLAQIVDMVAEFRQKNSSTPVILMSYLNPMEAMGCDEFIATAVTAGVDGVLWVDLPPEEAEDYNALLQQSDLDQIFLLSPTTTSERVAHISAMASGYVYYVSLKGVTGSDALDTVVVQKELQQLRQQISLPIGVGFGIRNSADAVAIGHHADAVIVGSALIQNIADNLDDPDIMLTEVGNFIGEIRQALDKEFHRE